MPKHLRLTKEEIVQNIKDTYGVEVSPEDITEIQGFGRPTYVVDRGCQFTFLCRRSNLGTISQRKIQWY